MNAEWVERAALAAEARFDSIEQERRAEPRARSHGLARQIWFAMSLGATAVGAAALLFPDARRSPEPPEQKPAVLSEFHQRADLPALLFVKALDGGKATASYEIATRDSDGARRDALTLGDPTSAGPFLRASARIGGGAVHSDLFFVELARVAAEIGEAVSRASSPQSDPAVGGSLLLSDLTLEAEGRQRACLGFRFNAAGAADLSGVACGAVGAPLERAALTCLIGRLEATPSGAAAGLGKVLGDLKGDQPDC
jgi:hypothetical protein